MSNDTATETATRTPAVSDEKILKAYADSFANDTLSYADIAQRCGMKENSCQQRIGSIRRKLDPASKAKLPKIPRKPSAGRAPKDMSVVGALVGDLFGESDNVKVTEETPSGDQVAS